MPSAFQAEVAAASATITATFGRPLQLLPRIKQADRNAPVIPDTSRSAVTFLGDIRTPPAKALITRAYDARTDQRPGTDSEHPLLRVQPDQIAALGLVIGVDDLIVDPDQNQRWRVSSAHTTTHGVRECVIELV